MLVETFLMTGSLYYFGSVSLDLYRYIYFNKPGCNYVDDQTLVNRGFPFGEALVILRVVFTFYHIYI